MKVLFQKSGIITIVVIAILASCVKNRNFDAPDSFCISNLVPNTSYAELENLYVDKTFQIQEDLIIEGYVISSDKSGNFFSVLHFQDSPISPTAGFQIVIDLRDSHLFYPVGTKVFIKLKGLYLGKSKDVFKIGGAFTSFGNVSVGRLPSAVVNQHIIRTCEERSVMQPRIVSLNDLSENLTNTLVQFDALEIITYELGENFAIERKETKRTLVNCSGDELTLLNSGYSDFQMEKLPNGNGAIKGVLLRKKNKYQLAIRDMQDIEFDQDRCN